MPLEKARSCCHSEGMDKRAFAKLLVASAAIGLIVGVVSDLFIRAIQVVSRLVWKSSLAVAHHQVLAVVMGVLGGVIMGLCVKYFGTNDDGVGFEAVMSSVVHDGAVGAKQLKRVVLNAYVGLVTGASIGPEAPLITLGAWCGEFLAKALKVSRQQVMAFITIALGGSMGVLVDSPVAGPILFAERPPTKDTPTNQVLVFASMIAASVGFAIYYLLGAALLKGTELVPAYNGFRPVDLLYGLVIGLVGLAIGAAVKWLIFAVRGVLRQYVPSPIGRGLVAGLILGVAGAIWPLVMFDGSAQLNQLVTHMGMYSVGALIVLAVVRIVCTGVALGAGYQGGNIFPTIFICGAVGLAIHGLFGFVPAAVAMVACMASAMYEAVPLPLFTIFLFTEISSFNLVPVMAMSLVAAYVVQILRGQISLPQGRTS